MKYNRISLFVALAVISVTAPSHLRASDDASEVDMEQVIRNSRETGSKMGLSSGALDQVEGMIRAGKVAPPSTQPSDGPVAVLRACTDNYYVNQPLCLDGSDSYTPSGVPVSMFYFDFRNGGYAVGSADQVNALYAAPGTYTPSLAVMDPNGIWSDADELKLTVDFQPPDALYNATQGMMTSDDAAVVFDAGPSKAYGGARVRSFSWNICYSVKGKPTMCITTADMITTLEVPRSSSVRFSGELKVMDTNNKEGVTSIRMNMNTL